MRRIVYLCPSSNIPVGGIKVIYRHVEALNRLGIPAFVLHPADPAFRCGWFAHDARFLASATLSALHDFVVIPEVWTLEYGLRCQAAKIRYALFVQNGYKLYPDDDAAAAPLNSVVTGAELVLSISADTDQVVQLNVPGFDPARLLRVQFAIPACFMAGPGWPGGERTITFMPRKLPLHSARVAHGLRNHLPLHWRLQPIDGLDEAGCAAWLRASSIFLAFSEFEGLALPPLEAAIAGNLVIGYTGQGGREYWVAPNFQQVQPGDILGFVAAVRAAAARMDAGSLDPDMLRPGMARLAHQFSAAAEAESLAALASRVAADP